jgi:hypothetical protein
MALSDSALSSLFFASGCYSILLGCSSLLHGFRHLLAFSLDLRDPASIPSFLLHLQRWGWTYCYCRVTGFVCSPCPLTDQEGSLQQGAAILTSRTERHRRVLLGGLVPVQREVRLEEAPLWGLCSAPAPWPQAEAQLLLPSAAQGQPPPPPLQAVVDPGALTQQFHASGAAPSRDAGARAALLAPFVPGPARTTRAPQDTWRAVTALLTSLTLPDTETTEQRVLSLGSLLTVLGSVSLSWQGGQATPVLRIGRDAASGLALHALGSAPAPWRSLAAGTALVAAGVALLRLALQWPEGGSWTPQGGSGSGSGSGSSAPGLSVFHQHLDSDEPATDGVTPCCLCFERRPCIMLQPCAHMVLCCQCARRLLVTMNSKLCPICRGRVSDAIRVYTS